MSRLSCLLLAVAACGGSSPAPAAKPAPAPQPTARTADEFVPMCQQIFARKQTCADDYLPVLLDLRIQLNNPPWLADEVKTKGRDAALARAHTELASDTQPDKVAATCEGGLQQVKQAPPERMTQLLDQGAACLAAADCKAYSTCIVEIDREMMSGPPAH